MYYHITTLNRCITYYNNVHPHHKRLNELIDLYIDLKKQGAEGVFADELDWGIEYMLANFTAKERGI